jgi:hypothetical protein
MNLANLDSCSSCPVAFKTILASPTTIRMPPEIHSALSRSSSPNLLPSH